jgi:hypothetical protein
MIIDISLILLAFPIALFLINISHWNYLRRVLQQHDIFLKGAFKNSPEDLKSASGSAGKWITENLTEIKRQVKNAGVASPNKSFMEPVGMGYVQQQKINPLDNLLFLNIDIIHIARNSIEVAKGHYLTQAKLSLNPIHWIEVALFLPKEILTISGVEVTSKIISVVLNMVQILYWIALVVVALMKIKF